ncbi:MAG TPA: CARDB domain-containing protein [Burkholderiales bacterium]|nr:CARDB domain-containing protein [Burkholderiales bacterium]
MYRSITAVALLLASAVAVGADVPNKPAPKAANPNFEIAKPPQPMRGRPDITDGRRGIIIGGGIGGAGGVFVPWGGHADISGVAPLPGTVVQGRCAFNVTYFEKNIGTAATSPAYTNKLKTLAGDAAINGARHLNAGELKPVTTQPYLPEGASQALMLYLDEGSAVGESDEGNNFFSIKYTLRCGGTQQGKPDLVPLLPSPMNGNVAVKNIGAGNAGPSKLALKCHKVGHVGGGGGCADIPPAMAAPYIDAAFPDHVVVNVPALAPGASFNHALAFWGSLVWMKGKYEFKAIADAGAVVAESNEANNVTTTTLLAP